MYELTERGRALIDAFLGRGGRGVTRLRAADGARRAAEPAAPRARCARRARFRVDGMDCAACAKTVEKAVAALDGVSAAQVSFGTATLTVDGDARPTRVIGAVARAGYRARPADASRRREPAAPFWRRDARAVSTTASVVLLAAAVVASLAAAPRAVAEPLYLLSMAVGGWPIARAAAGGAAAPARWT